MATDFMSTTAADVSTDAGLAPVPEKGPGVQALEALLKNGKPEPSAVVKLIDANRAESTALFELLHKTLGNDYVQEVVKAQDKLRLSVSRAELVSGDPTNPEGGYFIASREEEGARWRTADGSSTGTINRDGADWSAGNGRFTGHAGKEGLDSRYSLDEDDALRARYSTDDKEGSLGWERDGRTQAELFGRMGATDRVDGAPKLPGDEYSDFGVRRPFELGGGTGNYGLRRRVDDGGATDGAFGEFKTADGRTSYDAGLGVMDGQLAGTAGVTHALSDRDTISGSIRHDARGTQLYGSGVHRFDGGAVGGSASVLSGPDGTTGELSAFYRDRTTSVTGRYTHGPESDHLRLGASHALSPQLSLSGFADQQWKPSGDQTTLGISERYRSGDLAHDLSITGGKGERDFLGVSGSTDVRLSDRMYAGAFGSYTMEEGKHDEGQIGGSLTFTPNEKSALSLIGVLNQNGGFETRLQYDLFKKKIDGASFLADNKKKALISLFLSYSEGGQSGMLDDRFGAGQFTTGGGAGGGDGQVMGGIRIRF